MKKNRPILRAAIAAACGLVAASATAGTFTGPGAGIRTYAAESVNGSTVATIPAVSGIYTTNGVVPVNSILTFTLQGGVTFSGSSVPAITVDAVTCGAGALQLAPGATSSSVAYSVTNAGGLPPGCKLNMGNVDVTNVSFLSTPADTMKPNQVKITLSGSYAPGFTDTRPTGDAATAPFLQSVSSTTLTIGSGYRQQVDIVTGAQKFVPSSVFGSGPFTTTTTAALGQVQVDSVAPAPLTTSTGNPAILYAATKLTLSGNFANIGSVYADKNPCDQAASSSKIAGTLTSDGTGASFDGLKAGTLYYVCAVASGSGVIWGVNNGISAGATVSYSNTTGTTALGANGSPLGSFSGAGVAYGSNFAALTYNGQAGNSDYVVGTSGGFASYLRAANNTATAQTVYATVLADSGKVFTGSLGTIGANAATLYTVADLNKATGSSLNGNTDRANVWLFMTGPSASFGNLLGNPDGTVTAVP
jgi:hypothetical protein